jgi:hypothetical protein
VKVVLDALDILVLGFATVTAGGAWLLGPWVLVAAGLAVIAVIAALTKGDL